ncbi:hypothetical protein BC833DRAFT_297057 [Globomyces pollinis-pini]|nr:hypothetical protein BC833DRAFT_297057 [Globomyces pollinis-pini]
MADLVAFVFIEHIFTVELEDKTYNKSQHGFILQTQPIIGLYGSDFEVDMVLVEKDLDETFIALVSVSSRLFVFSDKRATSPLQTYSGYARHYISKLQVTLESVFDDFIREIDGWYTSSQNGVVWDISSVDLPGVSESRWTLKGTWSNGFVGVASNVSYCWHLMTENSTYCRNTLE